VTEAATTSPASSTSDGINGEALATFRELVNERPGAFKRTVRASAAWTGGFRSEIRIRDHAPIVADEPVRLGGENAGPTPGELVLASFSSCLVVGYALQAHLRGITLRSLSVDVEGDSDPAFFLGCGSGDEDSGYHAMRVKVHLDTDADEAALDALQAEVLRTSPVGSTLAGRVNIEAVRVNQA
jgi:uncharacterized OsmC-like protein